MLYVVSCRRPGDAEDPRNLMTDWGICNMGERCIDDNTRTPHVAVCSQISPSVSPQDSEENSIAGSEEWSLGGSEEWSFEGSGEASSEGGEGYSLEGSREDSNEGSEYYSLEGSEGGVESPESTNRTNSALGL